MSGVTSRTLRHYAEIGLLLPAYVGSNGYRYYEEPQLLRLQRILVLRELRVGLPEIAAVLNDEVDAVTALRRHHAQLLAESDRLGQLARTVARTIAELESTEGGDMSKINRPENLFEGFDASKYDEEARTRWPEQFERSRRIARSYTPEQMEQQQRELTANMIRMAEFMVAGTASDDSAVLDEVDQHYRWIARFWEPDAKAYTCVGQMYVDDERFRANYEKIAEGLAEYQRDAMAAYARARLS